MGVTSVADDGNGYPTPPHAFKPFAGRFVFKGVRCPLGRFCRRQPNGSRTQYYLG